MHIHGCYDPRRTQSCPHTAKGIQMERPLFSLALIYITFLLRKREKLSIGWNWEPARGMGFQVRYLHNDEPGYPNQDQGPTG